MRRSESSLLHGPWSDTDPDADTLAELRKQFAARWTIWRSLTSWRSSGEWCARRIDGGGSLRRLSADSADALRSAIKETER